MDEQAIIGLSLLRKDFPAHQISKLPKPTKKQTEDVKANYKLGIRCKVCGTWHHPDVIHLDYVGHAALTDRLLDADPLWDWRPMALDSEGLPKVDRAGGLWIYLTVCGVTRPGYGHAGDKTGGDATKELIGDALRNAAMRFGAALDLWHKGDLHLDDDLAPAPKTGKETAPEAPAPEVDGDGDVVIKWTEDEEANIFSMLDKFDDLLSVCGMPEAEIDLRCQYYKDMKHKVPYEVAVNRLATAIAAAEKKAQKKLKEAENGS